MSVIARFESLSLPTYPLGEPERNPMFFERRVYQGSKGKVYPVPFVDKVYDQPQPKTYRSVLLENEFVRLVLLPEIGGRILWGQDKGNSNYDFFYRQDVIKPALVGLAGPWISGGVEFNWPQHHRPGTFLPADVFIEEEADGARTVWMSELDPLSRMKGMHGLRLRPGSSFIELRVRLYNRTPLVQTFLWWVNVAARVHDRYQSFFPTDVHYVADHACRAQSSFPEAQNLYYGVDYRKRQGRNDLTWYKNIPVPTSYMVCETQHEFFGGYDHHRQGGFVHVANRFIAPGKKQWTWGDHAFGHAWDRELTDEGGPYIELMAGAYTDNQPDFSYLAPGETKVFSQYFWPIRETGPVQACDERAALRLVVDPQGRVDLAVLVPTPIDRATIRLMRGKQVIFEVTMNLVPQRPFRNQDLIVPKDSGDSLCLELLDVTGKRVIAYETATWEPRGERRSVATEPPPIDQSSMDELALTGEHLEQYRHPTRQPEVFWKEMLARDPGDARAHLALGRRALRRGCFNDADDHLRHCIERLTSRHPNPSTGEAHYLLGLLRRWQGAYDDAYALLYKATWNYEWSAAAYYELALIDSRRGDIEKALRHLELSLDTNRRNNRALVLEAALRRRQGDTLKATELIGDLLKRDALDHWAQSEKAKMTQDWDSARGLSRNDAQTALDVAFDYAEAGLYEEAICVLDHHVAHPVVPAPVPNPLQRSQMTAYALSYFESCRGAPAERVTARLATARRQTPDYFFPSRLLEQQVLEWAIQQEGADALARYGYGNYLFDQGRHEEAIQMWTQAVAHGGDFSTLHRNLGIAFWNKERDGAKARAAYLRALERNPRDARLVSEFDQLCKKLNEPASQRLAFLEAHREWVEQRDDASVELAALYNVLNRPAEALRLLLGRRFHPWEGGEGSVLRQYTLARLLLGQKALSESNPEKALGHFSAAMEAPHNLGEAYHLLQAKCHVNYWRGKAYQALGLAEDATKAFMESATEAGDFSSMAVVAHSPLSYYRGLSLRELGQEAEANQLFRELKRYGEDGLQSPAVIDYFATSLPDLLVFDEDLNARKIAEMHLLIALACHGLGESSLARSHLDRTLGFSSVEPFAVELHRSLHSSPL